MNYKEVIANIHERLGDSKLHVAMKEWQAKVDVYPPTALNSLSDKRLRVVEAASSMTYPLHTCFSKPIADYGNSIILISNEVPVKYMIKEAAEFAFMLFDFREGIENFKKPLNEGKINGIKDINELMSYYKTFTLNKKKVLGFLIQDVHQYSEKYGFNFDKAQLVSDFEAAYTAKFAGKSEILLG